MARRDRELAVRLRLVPDTEAIVGRSGVHFLRGHATFYVDGRGMKKLAELYREIEARGFDEAVSALLPGSSGGSGEGSDGVPRPGSGAET